MQVSDFPSLYQTRKRVEHFDRLFKIFQVGAHHFGQYQWGAEWLTEVDKTIWP